jgi:glycosyltransferase involved in cell wall biosynthesis
VNRFSVVMPAYNESSVIERTLVALGDAAPGEIEVVVVCNGCSDDTASRAAAAAPAATVIVLDEASKSAALNAGDAAATVFPRFYVDADIKVSAADLRLLAGVLSRGERLAVSPTVAHGWRRSRSRIVRSYYRLWSRLPAAGNGIFGTGVIGLTAGARGRFATWPDVIADDYFCDSLFSASEKARHPLVRVELDVPATALALVRRKARVRNGNLQVRAGAPSAVAAAPASSLRDVVRRHPLRVVDVPAFVGVTLAARLLAAQDRRAGRAGEWRRDDSRSSLREAR